MIELLVGVVLAAAAVWFALQPIFRLPGGGSREAGAVEEYEDPDDDMSPRATALRALHEIEFDRATGKLSDDDYTALHQKYTGEALAAMRAESAGGGRRETGAAARPAVPAAARIPPPLCPAHGPRPEPGAIFCSECGRRLGSNPGYCARCGAGLEREARYCNACGTRVAA